MNIRPIELTRTNVQPTLITDNLVNLATASPYARQNIRFRSEEDAAMAGFRFIATRRPFERQEFGFQIYMRDGKWALGSLKEGAAHGVRPASLFNPGLPIGHNHPKNVPVGLSGQDILTLNQTRPDPKGFRNTYLMDGNGHVFKVSFSKAVSVNFQDGKNSSQKLDQVEKKVRALTRSDDIKVVYLGNARNDDPLPSYYQFSLQLPTPQGVIRDVNATIFINR